MDPVLIVLLTLIYAKFEI